jgi:membrane protein CcdC involved in cytochrome C biogenesis
VSTTQHFFFLGHPLCESWNQFSSYLAGLMIIRLIFKLHMAAQWFEMDSLSPHNWFLVYLLAIGAHQVIRYLCHPQKLAWRFHEIITKTFGTIKAHRPNPI